MHFLYRADIFHETIFDEYGFMENIFDIQIYDIYKKIFGLAKKTQCKKK